MISGYEGREEPNSKTIVVRLMHSVCWEYSSLGVARCWNMAALRGAELKLLGCGGTLVFLLVYERTAEDS